VGHASGRRGKFKADRRTSRRLRRDPCNPAPRTLCNIAAPIQCLRAVGRQLLRSAHNLFYFLNVGALLVDEQLRVTDDVDEKDVADLEFHVWRMLGRHEIFYYLKTRDLTSLFRVKTSLSLTGGFKHCAASARRRSSSYLPFRNAVRFARYVSINWRSFGSAQNASHFGSGLISSGRRGPFDP
jgi:hypothetical protein